MTDKLISRERECAELRRCMESDESEFIIVCGRRRIGKTFLVEQYFEKKYDFKYVGGHNMSTRDQLRGFGKALRKYSGRSWGEFPDWITAFDALEEYLEGLPGTGRRVVFIDEMPWMDSKRSDFVCALENFWNGWAVGQENIVLVATGSATSWMSDKLLKNRGGLHNRVTCRLNLKPFTLCETEAYLRSRHCTWDRYQILEVYMALGGVPYYLKKLNVKESAAQNIDSLFFSEDGALRTEFDELYSALFASAESYISVVRALSCHRGGISRQRISEIVKFNGSNLTRILKNLELCGFISEVRIYGSRKRGFLYQLSDFYTLFYFRFVDGRQSADVGWWLRHSREPEVMSWLGVTFELVCHRHLREIKHALGVGGVETEFSMWSQSAVKGVSGGGQIDMVMERADRIIHLFEVKFSIGRYNLTEKYCGELREREALFREATGTRYATVQTFLTTYGVNHPENWSIVHSEVMMDDLFWG
ncbi:MAG: AAA family ATPase [Bacteroidaceae bacterium]|nr:AAA family ATPase [Bacteroidaceae bacterium]